MVMVMVMVRSWSWSWSWSGHGHGPVMVMVMVRSKFATNMIRLWLATRKKFSYSGAGAHDYAASLAANFWLLASLTGTSGWLRCNFWLAFWTSLAGLLDFWTSGAGVLAFAGWASLTRLALASGWRSGVLAFWRSGVLAFWRSGVLAVSRNKKALPKGER